VKVPQFSKDDISGIADLIEQQITRQHDDSEVDLVVNGAYVPISPPLKDLLARTMSAMIPTPPDNGKLKSLHFSLRRKA
jgi:hypothetical protein